MDLTLTFPESDKAVRMVGTPEKPEWVAADVGAVLGIKNVRDTVRTFDEDEKGVCDVGTTDTTYPKPSSRARKSQQVLTITEAGVYRLLVQSRKPEAKAFRRWLFGEVLPSIRKTGRYSLDESLEVVLPPRIGVTEFLPAQALYDMQHLAGYWWETIGSRSVTPDELLTLAWECGLFQWIRRGSSGGDNRLTMSRVLYRLTDRQVAGFRIIYMRNVQSGRSEYILVPLGGYRSAGHREVLKTPYPESDGDDGF